MFEFVVVGEKLMAFFTIILSRFGESVSSIQVTKKESDLNLKSTKDRCPLWSPVFCYAALEATNNCLGNNIALIEVFLWPKKKTEMEE